MQLDHPLVKRTLASLVLIPLSLAIFIQDHFLLKASVTFIIAAGMAFEWASIAKVRFAEYVLPSLMLFAGYFYLEELPHLIYASILIPFLFVYLQRDKIFCIGAVYIALSIFACAEILKLDAYIFLWLLLVNWSGDIFAYFSGRTFGGPKLWVGVSPNKTWSGLIGGTIAATLIGGGFALYHDLNPYPFLLSLVLSLLGHGGDLLESAAKRHYNVKDTSNLIPGHGGLLDRMDSLLLILIGFKIYLLLMGK